MDKKARAALAVAVVLILAAPVLALRSCIVAPGEEYPVVPNGSDDQLVFLKDGTTLLLNNGPVGRKITNWLKLDSTDEHSFEVGDETFANGTADPTPEGHAHLAQFTLLLKAHRELKTQIVVSLSDDEQANSSLRALETARAKRLQEELVSRGVPPSAVTIVSQSTTKLRPKGLARRVSKKPQLFVVLSK